MGSIDTPDTAILARLDRIERALEGGVSISPVPPAIESEILARLTRVEAMMRDLQGILMRTVLRADSRKKQAEKAGVHPSTLWRRERRERMRQMVAGNLK
jgi:hypothetical protein